ncbi:MAG: Ig-like domain-containing protein [Gemmatimonadaceae bacterium]
MTQVPTNIRVTLGNSRLTVGRTLRLTATVLDAVNAAIANSPVAFASLNPALATVSTDGLVTSVGGLGAVTIRVSAPGTNVTQDITIPIVALSSPTGDDVQLIPTPLIYALRAFPNDSVIGVSYFGTASVINVSTGSVRSFDIPPAYGVDVAPGRSRVYMAGADGNLYEYDTHTWTSRLLSLGGQLFDVVVDPSERFAYVGLANLGVSVVDLNQWREVARDTMGTTALHLAINADGASSTWAVGPWLRSRLQTDTPCMPFRPCSPKPLSCRRTSATSSASQKMAMKV